MEEELKEYKDFRVPLNTLAMSSCKCNGKGHNGYNITTKNYVICKCFERNFQRLKDMHLASTFFEALKNNDEDIVKEIQKKLRIR